MKNPASGSMHSVLALCEQHLQKIVQVESYEFTSCYLWHDRPLYNDFGEQIRVLKGDTIYLYEYSTAPATDLFHELGHFVGRKLNLVANRENSYVGSWQQENTKLIAEVTEQRHWSGYLNTFAESQNEFRANAASELWAELFMLWHLYPNSTEARLIDSAMQSHINDSACIAIRQLAEPLRFLANSAS